MADPEKPADSQETPPEEVVEEGAEEETPAEEAAEEAETEEDPEKKKAIEDVNKKLGVPEQKKKPEPPEGSKRWNQIYKEAKEAARKTEELHKKLEDRDKDFELLRKHNEELMGVVKSAVSAPPAPEGKKPEAILKELKTQKQQLIQAKQKARADVDYDKAFELQDQIDVVQDQINDFLVTISQAPKKDDVKKVVKEVSEEERKEQDEKDSQRVIQDFYKRNDWFLDQVQDAQGKLVKNEKYDPIKADMVLGMERRLQNNWNGSYESLVKHIEEEVNKRFPPKASSPPPKIPAVGGTGGLRSEPGKVVLNEDQRRVARNLFPGDPKADEKYSEQLKLMRGGK